MIYLELFWAFFQVGLFSFGGGYAAVPLIQSQIVEGHHWLSMSQFSNLITIAEMTPGPIAVNCATFVGQQTAGFLGAVICTLGCVSPAFFLVLLLTWAYVKYQNLSAVQGAIKGLRPGVVAMIASAGVSFLSLALFGTALSEIEFTDFRPVEGILFCICLFLLQRKKAGAVAVILGTGLIGVILYLICPGMFV